MWMTDVKKMCRQHLLGEHYELHMLVGSLNKGIKLDGFAKSGLLELKALESRHDELANEIVRRQWEHDSPFQGIDAPFPEHLKDCFVDKDWSKAVLLGRCPECRALYLEDGEQFTPKIGDEVNLRIEKKLEKGILVGHPIKVQWKSETLKLKFKNLQSFFEMGGRIIPQN